MKSKYDGESPSKIETKTNILQTSKQWHILLSHRQQNFEQDFPHWVLPNWSKMGCKLRKLDKINYFLPSNWNLLEYSNQSATSIPSLFYPSARRGIVMIFHIPMQNMLRGLRRFQRLWFDHFQVQILRL